MDNHTPVPPTSKATGRWSDSMAGWAARWRGYIALGALVSALVGQRLLDAKRQDWLAAVLVMVAGLCAVLATSGVELAQKRRLPDHIARGSAWGMMTLATMLGLGSWTLFKGNRFSLWGTVLWGTAIVLMLFATRWRDPERATKPETDRVIRSDGLYLQGDHVLLLAIVVVGAFFRLHRIGEIPLEMGCDLPHIYNNIGLILDGEFLVFFPSHPGREGLFFYLAAPICSLFGLSHVNIKVASALVGVATLPVVYALGRRLYSRQVGLVAAAALAISHWHIILTRVGYRACTVPLVVSLIMLDLVRGMQTGRRWYYALAGVWLGLGLYTYNAMMLAPLVVAAMLLWQIIVEGRKRFTGNVERSLWLILLALLVFIPLGRYAYEEPDRYLYRAATRITSLETAVPSDIARVLAQNIARSLSMFNYRGDAVYVANVPYLRELGFVSAALFVLGVAFAVWRARKGYGALVLISLGGMLFPTALAIAFPHEVPNAIRAIGALPAASLLVGVGWHTVWAPVAAQWPSKPRQGSVLTLTINQRNALRLRMPAKPQARHVVMVMLVAALLWESMSVYKVYFRDYVSHLPDGNYSISLEMAHAIDDYAGNGESYIVVWPYWFDGNAVRAQVQRQQVLHREIDKLMPGEPPFSGPPGRFMVLLHPDDAVSLSLLEQAFPQGVSVTRTNNRAQPALVIFYGER